MCMCACVYVCLSLWRWWSIHSRTHSHWEPRRIYSKSQYQYCSINSSKSEERNWKERKNRSIRQIRLMMITQTTSDWGTEQQHLLPLLPRSRQRFCVEPLANVLASLRASMASIRGRQDIKDEHWTCFRVLIFVCWTQVVDDPQQLHNHFPKWKLECVLRISPAPFFSLAYIPSRHLRGITDVEHKHKHIDHNPTWEKKFRSFEKATKATTSVRSVLFVPHTTQRVSKWKTPLDTWREK